MKFHLYRVRLNKGGYDPYGVYWGVCKPGESLFEYYSDDNRYESIRAQNREDAKRIIRGRYPSARFYR